MWKYEKLYSVWNNMVRRCHNPKDKSYHSYGAKGIEVCEEWRNDFQAFKSWALSHGYKPTPSRMPRKWIVKNSLSIDRINPSGNYSPENCQWIPFIDNLRKLKRASIYGVPNSKSLFLRCPLDLKAKLQKMAAADGMSLNALIVSVLRQYAESKAG